MNLINYEKLNTLEKLNIFIILRIFRKKVEKKKDNKGIKLINTFLKDIYFKFGEVNNKKAQ